MLLDHRPRDQVSARDRPDAASSLPGADLPTGPLLPRGQVASVPTPLILASSSLSHLSTGSWAIALIQHAEVQLANGMQMATIDGYARCPLAHRLASWCGYSTLQSLLGVIWSAGGRSDLSRSRGFFLLEILAVGCGHGLSSCCIRRFRVDLGVVSRGYRAWAQVLVGMLRGWLDWLGSLLLRTAPRVEELLFLA